MPGSAGNCARLESGSVLSVGWFAVAVLLAVLLTMWVTFTLTRLDRLHARVDAAQAALDAQLVRRAAALMLVAESPDSGVDDARRGYYETVARAALEVETPDPHGAENVDTPERHGVENAVGRALTELAASTNALLEDAAVELGEAATRVLIARRFYNDAVRDTRTLRARRMPRLLHLAGRRAMPQYFDIDDTLPVPASALTLSLPETDNPTSYPIARPAKEVS
jgi:hypothetical protein